MDVHEEDEIIINVEENEIRCNRKKLIDASPYFDAMFNGNFTEKNQKTITLKVSSEFRTYAEVSNLFLFSGS